MAEGNHMLSQKEKRQKKIKKKPLKFACSPNYINSVCMS